MTTNTEIPVSEVIAAARELATAGRWRRAASLLDTTTATDDDTRALLALAAAEVALESEWFGGDGGANARLRTAVQICATVDLDPGSRWDLAFLQLRWDYFAQIGRPGELRLGPAGKEFETLAGIRRHGYELRDQAPDELRRGWAEMYVGLIADNLFAERDAAPAHYLAALSAGESGDDLLAREALRHLGDHDHDNGDHGQALVRWSRATELGARAGAVPGTLSQQMLLAVLARDAGDYAGADALAREIVRWAEALGAVNLANQATGFLAGIDPTAPPESDG